MLTLSRKEGERIMIGDGIVIEVADIRHNQVKLRITAPGLPVDREEIWERKRNSAYTTPDNGEDGL